ncbi:hypothetical protein DFH08DRAFT_701805 [Mycena albidolilacea]|uniref:DJ-1/PfpI domain-containing protein n=1 Tax=Mycena albidolilacea TaxID=1033008 RepID=A0AAD6ZY31_9AGAR|nr:hypothetical protein DFH08DRAFT_701805 [Mycena albidolilacea]
MGANTKSRIKCQTPLFLSITSISPIPTDFESGEHKVPEGLIPFISTQAPKAKYILSVCGGAGYLAFVGLLSGKRATTNKVFYRGIVVRSRSLFQKGFQLRSDPFIYQGR